METPAPHRWSALIIHITDGASNLVQLLEQQGYELTEQWQGPVAWRSPGTPLLDLAHLDLTRTSQSGTVLFLQTIAQLRSAVVAVTEVPDGPAADGGPGRSYLLQRRAEPGAAGAGAPRTATATAVDETVRRLRHELMARSSMQLAGGLAHDANNFLTAVTACLSLLEKEELPPSARGHLADMRAAGDRAAALLRQLAHLCRRQFHPPRVFDLNELILDLRRVLARLLGEEVRLDLDLDRRPCLVKADPPQFEQVLLNLAVNARDAMTRRGALSISTVSVPAGAPSAAGPARSVRLTVRDNGCGMPPDVLTHIFEPFYTTKEASQGTGLGLATVDRIIRLFGGRIDVDSTPGRGTTFTIDIPESAAPVR